MMNGCEPSPQKRKNLASHLASLPVRSDEQSQRSCMSCDETDWTCVVGSLSKLRRLSPQSTLAAPAIDVGRHQLEVEPAIEAGCLPGSTGCLHTY
jgi:hypothetical protein